MLDETMKKAEEIAHGRPTKRKTRNRSIDQGKPLVGVVLFHRGLCFCFRRSRGNCSRDGGRAIRNLDGSRRGVQFPYLAGACTCPPDPERESGDAPVRNSAE